VGNGIDNSLPAHFRRHLISDGGLHAVLSRTDSKVDLGEHEINSLIYQFKSRPFVDLVEWNRLSNLDAVKMRALYL